MKKIIVLQAVLMLCFACAKSEFQIEPKPVDTIKVKIGSNKPLSRVELGVTDGLTPDITVWSNDDFLYVFELNLSGNLTGSVFKYDYDKDDTYSVGATGAFKGKGITTGGSYLIVCTRISADNITLPTSQDNNKFICTFANPTLCSGSFGTISNEVQKIANQLLFVGTVTFQEDEVETVNLASPMSMIEVRLGVESGSVYDPATNLDAPSVTRLTINSAKPVFATTIHISTINSPTLRAIWNNTVGTYQWQEFNAHIDFPIGGYQPLSVTTPLRTRFIAFQDQGETTAVNITIHFDDESEYTYTAPLQSAPLTPNAVTVISVNVP